MHVLKPQLMWALFREKDTKSYAHTHSCHRNANVQVSQICANKKSRAVELKKSVQIDDAPWVGCQVKSVLWSCFTFCFQFSLFIIWNRMWTKKRENLPTVVGTCWMSLVRRLQNVQATSDAAVAFSVWFLFSRLLSVEQQLTHSFFILYRIFSNAIELFWYILWPLLLQLLNCTRC